MDEDLKGNPIRNNSSPRMTNPITTNVSVRKESEAKKFGKRFFSEDAKTVGSHVRDDVVVPSIKKLLSDAIKSAVDWLLYGSKGTKTLSGINSISYGSFYNRSGYVSPTPISISPNQVGQSTKPNNVLNVNEIIIFDRGEAEAVLLKLQEAIADYHMVSVADFYQLVGQKYEANDNNWGWTDLKNAEIIRVDGGYTIRFPTVRPIGQN